MKKVFEIIWNFVYWCFNEIKTDHNKDLSELITDDCCDIKFSVYVRSWGNKEQLVIDQETYMKLSPMDRKSYFQEDWIRLGNHWTRVV